ncbi:hypothetical protein PLEOSDRAFT_1097438 [Pleurotus ostreatus PC15]|uniref:Uncharacterized protein n=1 Tax=Pleurotus ostreatus (strain PC15) TaxID=1137138 RepID=A0A067NP01_PLEO1|nr:hypothetical protein PLEOSDRAFT_1097438 [Pleurotus ostreatus PC15]
MVSITITDQNLDKELAYFTPISRAVCSIIARSPNPTFREEAQSQINRIKSQRTSSLRKVSEAVLDVLGNQDDNESHFSVEKRVETDEDVLCSAMINLFIYGTKRTQFRPQHPLSAPVPPDGEQDLFFDMEDILSDTSQDVDDDLDLDLDLAAFDMDMDTDNTNLPQDEVNTVTLSNDSDSDGLEDFEDSHLDEAPLSVSISPHSHIPSTLHQLIFHGRNAARARKTPATSTIKIQKCFKKYDVVRYFMHARPWVPSCKLCFGRFYDQFKSAFGALFLPAKIGGAKELG